MTVRNPAGGNKDWAYQKALERAAKEVNLSPEELEKKIDKASEGLEFTPECLTLGEMELYPKLPKERFEHTKECSFCQRLVQVAEAGVEEVERFVTAVVGQESPSLPVLARLQLAVDKLKTNLENPLLIPHRASDRVILGLPQKGSEPKLLGFSKEGSGKEAGDLALRDEVNEVKEALSEVEKSILLYTLSGCDWNYSRAAQKLGIKPNIFSSKLRKYGHPERIRDEEAKVYRAICGENAGFKDDFDYKKEVVEKIQPTLTPREEQVLRMRFGIGEKSDHTLEEVGQKFTVARERIRQIEAKALRKLRHPSRSKKLKSAE